MGPKQVKVRVVARAEEVEGEAAEIVADYEGRGYECIGWSKTYPCKPPDEEQAIVHLVFAKGQGNGS